MQQRPDYTALLGASYDSGDAERATRKLVICSAPRTGSFELCRFLTAAGIGTPHEYFNPNFARQLAERWQLAGDPLHADNIDTYIDALLTRRVRNGVFATKLQFWQYNGSLRHAKGSNFLSDAIFVHLYRPDVVRQFNSLRVSQTTGRWDHNAGVGSPKPNSVESALSALDGLVGEDAGLRKLFVLAGKSPLFVTMDDVISRPECVVKQIGDAIGVTANLPAVREATRASKPYERDPAAEKQIQATRKTLHEGWLRGEPQAGRAENKIKELRGEIATLRDEAAVPRAENKRLREKNRDLLKSLTALKQNLADAHQNLREAKDKRAALAAVLETTRTSLSWRITAPLRRVRRLFRGAQRDSSS